MPAPTRLLIVGPLPPPAGGMANQTAQLQRLLLAEGVEVRVVNTQPPYWPAWVAQLRGLRAVFRLLPYFLRLWSACGWADVVHVMANSGWSWHLFAAPAIRIAKARRKPVIVNYRGGLAREFLARSAPSVTATLRGTTLTVPSRFLLEVFREFGVEAQVIPNVVDLSRFQPDAAATARTSAHVVVPRNLEHLYGVDLALRAMTLLRPTMPELRLSIAGSGVDRAALERLAAELGLTAQVRFTGQLAPEQMAALVRSADVILNPVRADNTPNSLLEALASGVPIVSTRVGGIPFLVEHGTTAWLVDPESPEAIAEGLRTVLGDAALRERLVRNGRDLAQSCSWPRVREQWLNTYRMARIPS